MEPNALVALVPLSNLRKMTSLAQDTNRNPSMSQQLKQSPNAENPIAASSSASETIEIDLRNPVVAGVLAWLIPGAGHLYQRRVAKGILFLVCILSTFFFGLSLGGGHVVYASLAKEDMRWHYFCQVAVGAPALPALLQTRRVRNGKEPLFGGLMAPPRNVTNFDDPGSVRNDELAQWHRKLHSYFELGTLYTMIAGLLNILAIYDAVGGPVLFSPEEDRKKSKPGGTPDREPARS